MTKNKRYFGLSLGLVLCLLVFSGCAKAPTDEMNAATDAVAQAQNDPNAVKYGASSLSRAKSALSSMNDAASNKQYNDAKSYAAEATSAAQKAISDGKTGAQQAQTDAANLVNGLQAVISETEQNLQAARKVKGIKLDFKSLSKDLDSAKSLASQAGASLSAANYPDAIDKANQCRSILGDITTKISSASIKTSKKK